MYQTTDQNHRPPPKQEQTRNNELYMLKKKKKLSPAPRTQAEDVWAPWTAKSLTGFDDKRGENLSWELGRKNKERFFSKSGMPAACTLRKKGVVGGKGKGKGEKKTVLFIT